MDIKNSLEILSEIGRTENKPSKDKSYYFLSDKKIKDSATHIPTIPATPLFQTRSITDILSLSVEHQINSFILRETENENNNSFETLEVIDNAYKYAKYKKINDVLLPEIKNDLRDFILYKKK